MNEKVFISLPITSLPNPNREERIAQSKKEARLMADVFRDKGYDPITPFDVTKNGMTEPQCIGACITALLECDYVYFCRGWMHSKGCNLEYQAAKIYGIEII